MKFRNRPNQCVETREGEMVWLSRSVAVTACVVLIKQQRAYVLVNQRGPGLPDFVGYWNLPCGYLDYDESTEEAAKREIWEECGVDVSPLLACAEVEYFSKPWYVSSIPRDAKQNVSIHHGLVAKVTELPTLTNQFNEADETTDMQWLELENTHTLTFAFNHQQRIAQFVELVKKTLQDVEVG